MWIKATQASVAAGGILITINSGESASAVQAGDAAILGNNSPVEIKGVQQAVGGQWQLVLQDAWPYAAVTNGALRVQPNGGRFEAAIQAMRDINTYAANTHAAMNEWLTSTAATISVEKADGSSVGIPTLSSYTSNWGTAALKNVGEESGELMQVGAFGLGQSVAKNTGGIDLNTANLKTGFYSGNNWSNAPVAMSDTSWGYLIVQNLATVGASGYSSQIFILNNSSSKLWSRTRIGGTWGPWLELYSKGNTTVDSNGFIKAASPIIKLYADSIETNDSAIQQSPALVVNGVGDYTITGTSGFAQTGWYINTPTDANGNIKVFVEYEQVEQPDGTYNIDVKTYEPDYSTGPATAGAPLDIPAGRWIDIRLQALPTPEIEAEV
ncbi:hypothetical protein KDN34_02870 [Shewanella yunxiaonensis]|uniref:Phage tail protein C-terminal domain-containing protein n=1 Tax=Shewanella yunxiaonensis TaxID=2829809 RepID=A0ABX7YUF6_9GAMM|nr:pyocin knob domain-containing protein [Shewanella yunxiaonensis]QUN06423.1 hypothetical protein KDN34_02870 [Shewanella yunxiaonensis]